MSFAMIGAPCEAAGHPSDCQEPAVGEVKQTSSHNITFTDTDKMSPITINGSQIYLVDTAVTSDPGSGGDVEIVSER